MGQVDVEGLVKAIAALKEDRKLLREMQANAGLARGEF